MIGRAIAVLFLAVTAGVALSVALLGTGDRYGGLVSGEWWIPGFVTTSIGLGWITGRLLPPPHAVVLSALAAPVPIAIVLAVKFVRWPSWPLLSAGTGGFEGLALVVAVGAIGGALMADAAGLCRFPRLVRWIVSAGVIASAGAIASAAILAVGAVLGGS